MKLWLNPLYRTYRQVKDSIFTEMNIGAPEITDYSEANPFVKWISVAAGLFEQLGYYIDFQGRESNISTCRRIENARKIAKANDYRIKAATPASVLIKFMRSSGTGVFTIPAGTECTSIDGIRFETVADCVFDTAQTFAYIYAKQINSTESVVINAAYVGGVSNAEFLLEEPTTGGIIADSSVQFYVNSLAWNSVQTLAYSNFDGDDFVQTVNASGIVSIETGDAIMGAIVPSGNIEAIYQLTSGAAGNVGVNTITSTAYSIPSGMGTLALTNENAASGGTDFETIERLRMRVPKLIHTLLRAVTFSDYENVAALCNGVAHAGVVFNCGKKVQIYIVPEGGGIASHALVADEETWMDEKKMVTTDIEVLPAGEIGVLLNIEITAKSNYSNAIVQAAVLQNLLAFLSYDTQRIKGEVQLSDIYEVVENTEGVRNSRINGMTARPYGRPINGTTTPLNWAVSILPISTDTNYWKIRFISSTQYQVFRNNLFLGTQTVATTYITDEIEVTVGAAAYVLGDEYEFYTYNYFGTIQLVEPSVPVSVTSDITLNTIGGY